MTPLLSRALWLGAALLTSSSLPLSAAAILVPNASFEDPDRTGATPAYSTGSPTGWTFASAVNWGVEEIRDARFGVTGPEGSRLDGLGGAGDQVGYINIGNGGTGSATTQVLAQIAPDTLYTLAVAFSQRSAGDRLPDGQIGLWVNGAPVGAFTTYLSSQITGFEDVVYSWTSPAAGDPLIGGDLQIRLEFTHSPGGAWEQAQFDHVRLDAVPEPGVSLLGTLFLGCGCLLRRRPRSAGKRALPAAAMSGIPASTWLALAAGQAMGTPIEIPNSSFEDPDRTGANPAYSSGAPAGWTFTSAINWGVEEIRDNRFGTGGAEGSRLTALGGEGDQVGYINVGNSGTATATSGIVATLEPDTTYTLTIALGQRASGDRLPDGAIGLWAGGVPVGTPATYASIDRASGSFTAVVYTWNSPPAGDPLIGAPLQVRMDFTYSADAGGWQQAQFDHVRLASEPFLPANRYYWDLNGAAAGAGGASPSGVWDAASPHWTAASGGDGAALAWPSGGDAVFAAGDQATGAYSVNVAGIPQTNSLTVRSGQVTLNGGALEQIGAAQLNVLTGTALTVQSVLSGTAGLRIAGDGDLTLAAANTYSGATRLAGFVRARGGSALPDSSPVEVAGALTLEADETLGDLSGAGVIDLTDRTLTFGGADGGTFGGRFVGTGNLVKQGAGALTLTGQASEIEGTLTIAGGVVNLATPDYQRALGGSPGIIVNAGGTLRLSATNVLHVDRGADHTPVTVNAGGTVELDAPHNHFGTLFLNGGTVTGIGEGMHRNEYSTFDQNVTVRGSQASRIDRTTTGGFALTGPAVVFDIGATGDPLGADLLIEAPLVNSETPESGGILKSGPGTLVLAADNTYTGPTAVEAGALRVKGALASAAISVASGATLDFSELGGLFTLAQGNTLGGTGTVAGSVDVAGTLSPGAPLGQLTFHDELTLFSSATYRWETGSWSIDSAPGAGYDSVTAATLVFFFDGAPLRIQIAAQALAGFTETDRSFTIAHATNGITGFSAADLEIDDSEFADTTGATGSWSIEATGTDLVLHYHAGTGLNPYQAWANAFAGLTDRAPATDFDHDGIDNLGEFAFNGEPTRSSQRGLSAGGLATVNGTPQVLTLSVAVRAGAVFSAAGDRFTATRDGVTYTIEASADLAAWGTLPLAEVAAPDALAIQSELTEPEPGWEYHTFRLTGSAAEAARGFIRATAGTTP